MCAPACRPAARFCLCAVSPFSVGTKDTRYPIDPITGFLRGLSARWSKHSDSRGKSWESILSLNHGSQSLPYCDQTRDLRCFDTVCGISFDSSRWLSYFARRKCRQIVSAWSIEWETEFYKIFLFFHLAKYIIYYWDNRQKFCIPSDSIQLQYYR